MGRKKKLQNAGAKLGIGPDKSTGSNAWNTKDGVNKRAVRSDTTTLSHTKKSPCP